MNSGVRYQVSSNTDFGMKFPSGEEGKEGKEGREERSLLPFLPFLPFLPSGKKQA
jgi:hypothetical protein